MAASSGFTARVYGMIEGSPPYTDGNGATAFSRTIHFDVAGVVNLPSTPVTVWPLPNGTLVGNAYVYSVIQLPPTGLSVHGVQYVSDSSAATLATSRG